MRIGLDGGAGRGFYSVRMAEAGFECAALRVWKKIEAEAMKREAAAARRNIQTLKSMR